MKLALFLALATVSASAAVVINTDPISRAAERHSFEWFGLTVEKAKAKAATQSTPFRVVQKDGKPLPRTKDYRPGRINAHVEGNRVIAVSIEGQSQRIVEGVIDTNHLSLLGYSEEEAATRAQSVGLPFRVVMRDGKSYAVTLDYIAERANATVEDGIVVAITPG